MGAGVWDCKTFGVTPDQGRCTDDQRERDRARDHRGGCAAAVEVRGRPADRRAGGPGPGRGTPADRRGRAVAAADQAAAGVRPGRRDHRPPRLRQARPGRQERRQLPQRHPRQDRAHRGRTRRDIRAPRPGRHLRAEDRAQAAEAAVRRRRDGHLTVREGPDDR